MNTKAKGSRNELKAKRLLEAQGYDLVVKAGASLGVFDLIALGVDHDCVLLIQVKSNRRPGRIEMDRLGAFQCPRFCRKQVWVFRDRQPAPIIEEVT